MTRLKSERGLPAPARIWVLLASEASTAVIFRRGPSRWTRLYVWDTKTDKITPESWFAGRLYEDMSDLSPDGEHLLYFARNESQRRQQAGMTKFGVDRFVTWTALCRPPWVKATGLWNASDDSSSGGVFADNRTLWLLHGESSTKAQIEPIGFTVKPLPGVRFPIMLGALYRTGWRHTGLTGADTVLIRCSCGWHRLPFAKVFWSCIYPMTK